MACKCPASASHQPQFVSDPVEEPDLEHPLFREWAIAAEMPEVHETLIRRWFEYRQRFNTRSDIVRQYYFRTVGDDVTTNFSLRKAIEFVYNDVAPAAFTFNIGMTVLLKREMEEEPVEYMVLAAQRNWNDLFPRNIPVHDEESLDRARREVAALYDFADMVDYPDREWRFVTVLGFGVFAYLRPNHHKHQLAPHQQVERCNQKE